MRTTSTRLAAKASPYNSAVTIYERPEPRRSSRRIKQEAQECVKTEPKPVEALERGSPSKKSVSKSKAIARPLEVPLIAPERWADAYAAIKAMRSCVVAPVDTMGCEQAQLKEQDPKNQRFSTLISLMLSSQTKDEVTDAAVNKLRAALGGTLCVQAMLDADEATVSEAIAKVGFWRRKTQYIKQATQRLRDEFDDDVPKTAEQLCSLPGVGPKMAFLALQVAWKLNVGIGVDVHVHRITNRLGWHARPTRTPEETRVNLESWLPKELHGEINHLLVGFGQTICLPVGPKCSECTLSVDNLCPSARVGRTKTKVRSKTKREIGSESEIKVEPSSPQPRLRRQLKPEPDAEPGVDTMLEESGPKIEIKIEDIPRHLGAEDVRLGGS